MWAGRFKVFKLENSSVEFIQSEEENLKRTKKDEKILRDLWATSAIQQ